MLNELYNNPDNGISGVIYNNGRTIKIWTTGKNDTLLELNMPVPSNITRAGLVALVDNYPKHYTQIFKLLEDLNSGEGNK